jgi:hypothetical protein
MDAVDLILRRYDYFQRMVSVVNSPNRLAEAIGVTHFPREVTPCKWLLPCEPCPLAVLTFFG